VSPEPSFIFLSKPPVYEPPPGYPTGERVAISTAFSDMSLEFLKKSSSDKKKSHPSLEGPRKGTFPPCPQKWGPYGNRRPFSEPSFTYCSGSPLKEPLSRFPSYSSHREMLCF